MLADGVERSLASTGRDDNAIVLRRGSTVLVFPLGTCVALSLLLSLLAWVVRAWRQ